jgi:endonuclease/exonuclease/phosphatase family metal-dependent hydrolase
VFDQTIAGLGADILCLQEALHFQLDHTRRLLPGFEYVGVGRNNGLPDGGEMVPVLWHADRFELIDSGHFWVSPTPHLPGVRGWDADSIRMTTWVALRFREHPRSTFQLFCTHLDNHGPIARLEGARLLRRRIAALGPTLPVILTGDFNSTETDPPYAEVTAAGLTDAFRVANPTPDPRGEGTRHDFTGRRDVPRIDWIMVTPHWRVRRCRIDHTSHNGSYPSDHYPVVAELEFTGG